MKLENIYCFAKRPKKPEDFWELNEEMSYIEPFASFVDEPNSAKIMTAIWMVYDPKSPMQNGDIPLDQAKRDIAKNFLGDESFSWRDYGKYIRAFNRHTKTKIERQMEDWFLSMEERKQFMSEFSFEDDPELKEKMLLQTEKHFEKYIHIQAQLKEERQEALMHGNYTPSLLESTAIQYE